MRHRDVQALFLVGRINIYVYATPQTPLGGGGGAPQGLSTPRPRLGGLRRSRTAAAENLFKKKRICLQSVDFEVLLDSILDSSVCRSTTTLRIVVDEESIPSVGIAPLSLKRHFHVARAN